MQTQKYYTVWAGRKTGVFSSWKECRPLVIGFRGARFKSFPTLPEAKRALNRRYRERNGNDNTAIQTLFNSDDTRAINNSLIASGTCNLETGEVEISAIHTGSGQLIFWKGPFHDGTPDMAEFIAIVETLRYLKPRKLSIPVYSESATALNWVRDRHARPALPRRQSNMELYQRFDECMAWLHDYAYYNRTLKWDTESWGRSLGDFRRM